MAQILIIDDDPSVLDILSQIIKQMGHEVAQASTRDNGLRAAMEGDYDIIILDLKLPEGSGLEIMPALQTCPSAPEIIILTGTGDREGAELAFSYGAWAFMTKPFSKNEVRPTISCALEYRQEKKVYAPPRILHRTGIIGDSPQMEGCLKLVAQAAASKANVLITGETGTGKELFARAIHANSHRAEGSFVIVDCTVLPESLVESILFGYVKGAFTSAEKAQEGLIKQSDGGTLFLDEIGELPYNIQKSFLRVLQEHTFRPLGSSKEMTCDFRLLAATNRDLAEMVSQGLFREDLYHRLQAITIKLPPLRDHPEDIKELTYYYLPRLCSDLGLELKGASQEFLDYMFNYSWPGNIRELTRTLERAILLARDDPTLHPKHLPPTIRLGAVQFPNEREPAISKNNFYQGTLREQLPSLKEYREAISLSAEKEYLSTLLSQADGLKEKACRISGLSETRLYALLKKHGLPRFGPS